MNALLWPILLLVVGLVLLVAEVFVPSGGIVGILALGFLVISLYQAFTQTDYGWYFVLAEFCLLPVALMVAVYLWPRTPLAKKVFLRPPDPDDLAVAHSDGRLDHLVGQFGRALTPLRPSGLVDFDGRRLDGVAEDGLIPSGSLVRAVRVHSGRLVVRTAGSEVVDPLAEAPQA